MRTEWERRASLRGRYDEAWTAAQFNPSTGVFEVVNRASGESHTLEPWQMSRDEFVQSKPPEQGDRGKGVNFFAVWAGNRERNREGQYKISGKWYHAWELNEPLGRIHEKLVKGALGEGKSVPPEVLADYPDLAAKYGKPVAPPAAAEVA